MTPTWTKAGLIGLGTGLLLGLWLARGRPVDPVVLHRIDTILVDSTASRRVRDSLLAVSVTAQKQARHSHAEAQRLRGVVDSLRLNPEVQITTIVDTVLVAYDSLQSAYQSQVEATASLRAEVALGEQRIGALERALGEARTELLKTRKPSRFGLGCAGGYGASLMGGVVHASPAVACGVTFRIR